MDPSSTFTTPLNRLETISSSRPWPGAERTGVLGFDPTLDAVVVEWVVTLSPHDPAVLSSLRVSHAKWGRFRQKLLADGAVIDVGVPTPDSDGVPLLQLENIVS